MKTLLTTLLVFSSLLSFAQPKKIETIYLGSDFTKTRQKKAVYVRTVTQDSAGIYHLNDYRIDGEKLVMSGTYIDDKFRFPHGNITKYYSSGKVKDEVTYISGVMNGVVKCYYENGNIKRLERYHKDTLVGGLYYTPDGRDTIMPPYKCNPKYKDGMSALKRFIDERLSYPGDAERRGIEGVVYVGFAVDEKGNVTDVKTMRSPDDILNAEAERVVKLTSRHWSPGYSEGEPTAMALTIPVVFRIK